MLINHDERGYIYHRRNEPNDPEVLAVLLAEDGAMLVPGIQLPPVVVRDDEGNPIIEEGKVKRVSPGYVEPTHEYHMVKDGKVVDRPRISAGDAEIKADGVDAYVVSDLPAGSVILLDGQEIALDDGTLEFTTTDAGTYVFEAGFPFVDWRARVVAV
ncbi:hypothetical protein [Phyllobacterium lublinensis]|uniref:hypothetical protein n=1 Tax=Phyllobacterium lublinensis TaxID=2875708 RepID=UPI001CCA7E3C|nr:hypothetical protein [Phyllobacterium sp. 2063]MBZ9653558.1 hypothetical protein [Phyllobacterium sp. 2063]